MEGKKDKRVLLPGSEKKNEDKISREKRHCQHAAYVKWWKKNEESKKERDEYDDDDTMGVNQKKNFKTRNHLLFVIQYKFFFRVKAGYKKKKQDKKRRKYAEEKISEKILLPFGNLR